MNKYDIFIRTPRARKWSRGCTLLATSIDEAAKRASAMFTGRWCKVTRSIIFV